MVGKTFHLAQVSIILLFIFYDYGGIDTNSQSVGGLVFFASLQMRAIFQRLN